MKAVAVGLLLFTLGGCVSPSVPTENESMVPSSRIFRPDLVQPGFNTGRVVVKRDAGAYGSNCHAHLYVDGIKAVEVASSEKVELYLARGRHVLGIRTFGICALSGGDSQVEAFVREGHDLMFRINSDQAGFLIRPVSS